MKKFLLSLVAFFVGMTFFNANANDTGTFYVTCKVKVADDSNGRGTVYIDNDGVQTDEETRTAPNQIPAVESKPISFDIVTVPAEGYVFSYFTDQNGQPHYYDSPNSNSVTLTGYSEDINNPTFYELSAHFVPEGELPEEEFIEVAVTGEDKFATFIAPIDVTLPDGVVAYKLTGIKGDAVELEALETQLVPAFTAVVLENVGLFDEYVTASYSKDNLPNPLPSLTTGLLTGTLEDLDVAMGNYVLYPDGEDSVFVKVVTEVAAIDAYTCYMTVEGEGANFYGISMKESGINTIAVPEAETVIYDINGVRLDRLQKGINIVNGVKVIVSE